MYKTTKTYCKFYMLIERLRIWFNINKGIKKPIIQIEIEK